MDDPRLIYSSGRYEVSARVSAKNTREVICSAWRGTTLIGQYHGYLDPRRSWLFGVVRERSIGEAIRDAIAYVESQVRGDMNRLAEIASAERTIEAELEVGRIIGELERAG